jgi:starvation-inducible DNA-binding protein
MTNPPLVDALQLVLANSYCLYLKTQNYHWNVTGPNFKSLHSLFEEQFDSITPAIDKIAERIRSLGHKTPASLTLFASITTITEGNENISANQMVIELYEDQQALLNTLTAALKIAKAQDDEVTGGILIEQMTSYEKNAWMLKSSIE